jgi:hypothetical protein
VTTSNSARSSPGSEYGLVVPLLAHVDGGVTARGAAEWLVLTTPGILDLGSGRGARSAKPERRPNHPSGARSLHFGADTGTYLIGA